MVLINRKQISLYEEAKAGFSSLVKQTGLVFGGLLAMLLLTGGNPPGFVVGLSFLLGTGFVAWSEKQRLTEPKYWVKITKDLARVNLSGATAVKVDSMKAEEVLERYKAGERNFRRVNLRGQSFKGKDLSGADFTQADIRGANFTKADIRGAKFTKADIRGAKFTKAKLQGANFTGVEAGLQFHSKALQFAVSWLLSLILSFASAHLYSDFIGYYFSSNSNWIGWVAGSFIIFAFILVFYAIKSSGFTLEAVREISIAVLIASFVASIIVTTGIGLNPSDPRPAAPGLGAVLVVIAVVISVAIARNKNIGFFCVFVGAIAGTIHVLFFLQKNFSITSANFVVQIALLILLTVATAWLSYYVAQQAANNSEKFSLVRTFSIAFAALGGTSFCGANLTDADFSEATLESTDFREAILMRTCWRQAEKLDLVRPGTTYLRNLQLRQWLLGNGRNKDFERQDLRGVNLKGANLADASFIGADLSKANLQDADLSRAKLVQTQLDETDLTGATLTGACIEDWGITSHTKLDGVRCEYVFMRYVEPKDLDQNRRRKPDNWEEKFEDGDFADFIKPIVDTLDLYHNQSVDPRAIAISFKQLAENNPDAELEIVAMEKRGQDKFLLRAKTALDVDHSALSAEYFDTYNQLKALAEQERQRIIAEKDNRIRSLETMIKTALKRPSFYAENYQNQGDTMSEHSETSSYNLSHAKFGGGFAGTGGTQTGGTLNDYSSNQNLSEAAAEIQRILNQLELTNPTTTRAEKMTVAAKAVDEIEKDSVLKTRVIAALNSAGTEAFKSAINHPLAKNMVPIIEEWISSE